MRHGNDEGKGLTHNLKKMGVSIPASLVTIGPLRRDFPRELRQMRFFLHPRITSNIGSVLSS